MGEGTTKIAAERASQCCIEPACGASYAIDERLYSCPRCGGLLEIVLRPESRAAPQAWRAWWEARAASCDPRDASGVWRYREVLPFADDAPIVTLGEATRPSMMRRGPPGTAGSALSSSSIKDVIPPDLSRIPG